MRRGERMLHGVFLVSFMLLVGSGFLLLLPDAALLGLSGSREYAAAWRQALHRGAGAVMVICGVIHVLQTALTTHGRENFRDLLPRLRDARDLLANLAWMVGRRPAPPRFARFSYKQKAEYLALIAGTLIVCTTGALMWTQSYWDKFFLDLAKLVHGLEATLAATAIVIWHFYEVHVRNGHLLTNSTWIDGRMDAEELRHEHAEEFERLLGLPSDQPLRRGKRRTEPLVLGLNALAWIGMLLVLAGGAWLIRVQYFSEPGSGLPARSGSSPTAALPPAQAFHRGAGPRAPEAKPTRPACLACHGYTVHVNRPERATLINMHERYLGCQVCHLRVADLPAGATYRWFDDTTLAPVDPASRKLGQDGLYQAKLYPATDAAGGLEPVAGFEVTDPVRRWIADRESMGGEPARKAQDAVHDGLTNRPVACRECHGAEPFLDLAALGYPAERVEILTGARLYPQVTGHEGFYLPDLLDGAPAATEDAAAEPSPDDPPMGGGDLLP